MKFDVIVLAGGLGTRLKSVVSDVPKPMAPVAGKPFVDHILASLPIEHISNLIFSVGYKHEVVSEYYGEEYKSIPITYSIEEEPLGTGGGIKLACQHVKEDLCLLINGDTFFGLDYECLFETHITAKADITLALKQVENPARYGTVLLEKNRIVRFSEKREGLKTGLINAGSYLISTSAISALPNKEKFSFETDFLEKGTQKLFIGGYIDGAMFIDIGIPEDYERAQHIFTAKS